MHPPVLHSLLFLGLPHSESLVECGFLVSFSEFIVFISLSILVLAVDPEEQTIVEMEVSEDDGSSWSFAVGAVVLVEELKQRTSVVG